MVAKIIEVHYISNSTVSSIFLFIKINIIVSSQPLHLFLLLHPNRRQGINMQRDACPGDYLNSAALKWILVCFEPISTEVDILLLS